MATVEERRRRQQAIDALFALMENQGRKDVWLADQLGISKQRLCTYKQSVNMAPEWVITKACKALGILPESIGWKRESRRMKRAS